MDFNIFLKSVGFGHIENPKGNGKPTRSWAYCVSLQGTPLKLAMLGLFTVSVLLLSSASVASAAPKRGANKYHSLSQVKVINEMVRATWKEYEVSPSSPATEGEWCRRLYLDLLGRIPSVEELHAFTRSDAQDKKSELVNKLLFDEEYTEEYARNWTTIWTNILIGRSGGTERNSLTSREGMQKYLRDSFARNKPYDRMVYELITATGSNAPGTENFNGAVNFLTMKLDEKAAQATAGTTRIFLGLQVQCTQCHNHPFNEWKQQKYWEMNAFFRQTRTLRRFAPGTRNVQSAELVNQDYPGESNRPDEADLFYELRNGLTNVAYPVFVTGEKLGSKSGYLSDVDRRTELGKMILKSEYMDRTIVNRMWGHFFGYGFTKPVDDMGPHNASTHPELLDFLAKEFNKSSFNLKELIRWITLSEAYSLSSKVTSKNEGDDPLLGETPKFTHYYVRQMRAEELYESLIVATEAHNSRGSYEEQEKQKATWMRQFIVAFGNDEGEETTTFNGTIPQALMMFNGDLTKKATTAEKGGFLWTVANNNLKPAQKIDYLFQAGLGRKASKKEASLANKLLYARKGNAVAAMQDLWWAILNSNEFIINH